MVNQRPGPVRLAPVFLPKVWAREELPGALASVMTAPRGTGEVWLASDRHHPTPVAAGPYAGWGLDRLVAEFGAWITGRDDGGGFPLLLKILLVGEWLSVQVHPDDAAARRYEGEPCGKNEAWHVLHADDGAEIIHGLVAGADLEDLRRALSDGAMSDVLARVAAPTGSTFFLRARTIHAPGPGLTILEIQQPSDLTYRFYDWDRPDRNGRLRELHVDKAMAVLRPSGPGVPVGETRRPGGYDQLVASESFALYRARGAAERAAPPGRGPFLLFVTRGGGRLSTAGEPAHEIRAGESWLVPAGVAEWQLAMDDAEVFVATAGAES